MTGLWQDSAILWRRAAYDPETFAVEWECVALDYVTAVCMRAADGAGKTEDRCVLYIKEGTSLVDGEVYQGGALCEPGDRLLPWHIPPGMPLPADGGYRIAAIEERVQGTGRVRHMKLVAR